MSNSNDIKWNKIQEIMEELSFPGIVITSPLIATRKDANTLKWELANKLYDIANNDEKDNETYPLPYSWRQIVNHVSEPFWNDKNIDQQWLYSTRDNYWDNYDFHNS